MWVVFCYMFLEKCPFILSFIYQISELVNNLLINIYHRIFFLLSSLKHLDLHVNNNYLFSKSLLSGLPSNTCLSSNITHIYASNCIILMIVSVYLKIVLINYIHDPSLLRCTPSKIAQNSSILLNNTMKN